MMCAQRTMSPLNLMICTTIRVPLTVSIVIVVVGTMCRTSNLSTMFRIIFIQMKPNILSEFGTIYVMILLRLKGSLCALQKEKSRY